MICTFCVVLIPLLFFGSLGQVKNCTTCSAYPEIVGQCDNQTGICDCVSLVSNSSVLSCFNYSVDMNYCDMVKCTSFDPNAAKCRNGRRSWITALLLSIFLINLGAANFYIERYELAVPQLVLGLILCCFQIGSCIANCARNGDPTIVCGCCCGWNACLSLLFMAWWIADLVQFATNARQDGSGCPLYR